MVKPGSAVLGPVIADAEIQGALGCGSHRVWVYRKGGQIPVGEITPIAHLVWNRKRDDISNAVITTNGFGDDCCQLLSELRSWMHEIVIFRDGVRVWEGPVTRIVYKVDQVEIEAKDVMAYLYRRIMRQGYSDAYRERGGDAHIQVGQGHRSVVERAGIITMNALAPYEPNVLPYLTLIKHVGDAKQGRVVPDYSRTAWEEIDDLAATAGLDYVTVGRRIVYWDTHRPIGRLPEMRDDDFSEPPVVTEYGMNLANYFAVTNNSGVWGAATPSRELMAQYGATHAFDFYGPIELLASQYGESEADGTGTLTPTSRADAVSRMEQQARRNMANRWPTPLVVRVPDNSAVNPEVNLGINQLVPGVWIPVRAVGTCRVVAQWQKLDQVTVEEKGGKEWVRLVMSPAPNGGRDPDEDQAIQNASDTDSESADFE